MTAPSPPRPSRRPVAWLVGAIALLFAEITAGVLLLQRDGS